ncbi:MAG: hypothetical protein JO015_21655 [Verrucomicrobia bacterium]|nr:hypothetical protein [Verrucomicrobiota bacterium]
MAADPGQVATARVWDDAGNSGVPVGVQVAVPLTIATGWPSEVTRSAPTVHWAVTHGPLPAGGTKAHPAIS